MDDRGNIYRNPTIEDIVDMKLVPLSELEARAAATMTKAERQMLYNTLVRNKSSLPTTATDANLPLHLENTARSAKTEIEKAMDRVAALMPGYFGGNDREGISKEERRKRTKMKKAAKKQRRK